jgi:uncharacterized protein YggE
VQNPIVQGISVNGHGEARGEPDLARITVGVESRAPVAAPATEEVNRQMAAVVAALQAKGIGPADRRTQGFSISFEQQQEPYPPPEPGSKSGRATTEPEAPRGFYRVSNNVQITVRDLNQLGAILGAVTEAGANNIWGIEFSVDDPSKLEAQAREKALAQASARAEHLARLAGVKLGPVMSVSDSGSAGLSSHADGYGYSFKAAQANVPVERGQLTVSEDVQVVFSLAH